MKHAVGVGLSQVLALMPGVSRSGITITAGRFLGLGRDAAARFSFLIYTPIVLGAVLYKAAKLPGGAAALRLAVDVPARDRRRRDRGIRLHLGPARLPAQARLPPVRDLPAGLAALILLLILTGVRDATL